jgi:hypothetical protein
LPVEQTLFAPGKNISVFSKAMRAFLFSSIPLVISPASNAALEGVPLNAINHTYTINSSMMDNLNALVGKEVTVFLDGGAILIGKVKSVGADLVHLEKNDLKDTFNALLRIKSIQAIEVQSETINDNKKR